MATVAQKGEAKRLGIPRVSKLLTLTMAAGANVDDSFTPPAGSTGVIFRWATATAFTGTPTNINLSIGTSAGGQQYVANTDVKAASGWTNATEATSNVAELVASTGLPLYVRLAASGGTNPAGTAYLLVEYTPPAA